MIHAYNELYLDDAMSNLGDMLDYAICDCSYPPDEFFSWFNSSKIAEKIETGNPKYIAGMSGVELASEVVFLTFGERTETIAVAKDFKGPEYWTGWIMAYYQWYRKIRFSEMAVNGLSVSEVLSMYILHEADESKFVEVADGIIKRKKATKPSKLSQIRKARRVTQQELSVQSGVSLRMIQLYEQRKNDIGKAQAGVVLSLSKVLGCSVEDLME